METPFSTWHDKGRSDSAPLSLPEASPLRALMGWDGIIIKDPSVDIVDMTREYAARAKAESCGRCFPCRMGTEEMSRILENLCLGKGKQGDLERLRTLACYVAFAARCDIGKTSPRPILDALDHFQDRFLSALEGNYTPERAAYAARVTAPCIQECPARLDIPGYVELVGVDHSNEALKLVDLGCCLPGAIGRVCVRTCETRCTRKDVDGAVSIKALKRYAADTVNAQGPSAPQPAGSFREQRVAIIGAGPAGLSCAYYLGLHGYRTTLFEALGEPGGMAAVGIPDYRLPRNVLRGEADKVRAVGGEIRYGVKVGVDISLQGILDQGYKAIFVAAGAPGASKTGFEGEDAGYAGFMPGVEFLRRVAFGERPLEGKKICVVGGGNVAMDCVRSARRIGFEDVNLLYRRTEKEMPADRAEVEESKEEGVHFRTLVIPVKIIARNGRVTGVECVRMTLGEPDASGRRSPIPLEGSNFVIDCDAVVPAAGQVCEIDSFAMPGMQVARNNTLVVDPATMQSSDPRIFGGGDCVTGPKTLIMALAAGRRAARHIAQYLATGSCAPDNEEQLDAAINGLVMPWTVKPSPFVTPSPRQHAPVVDPAVRINNFSEVEGVLSPAQARDEADRCLRCYRIALGAFA